MSTEIPKVKLGIIGGSTLWNSGFPNETYSDEVIQSGLIFGTPFGKTAKFTHARIGHNEFLFVPYHGITRDILPQTPDSAFERVFYVLYKAGVQKIISSATCGSLDPNLKPGDFLVLDDFINFTTHRAISFGLSMLSKNEPFERTFIILRQPFFANMSKIIFEEAKKSSYSRVLPFGTVAVVEGPRFESPAEVRFLQKIDAHVVSHHIFPEVVFARELGACYSAFHVISNYGEGLVTNWTFDEMIEHDKSYSSINAEILTKVIKRLNVNDMSCGCATYRTPWSALPEE